MKFSATLNKTITAMIVALSFSPTRAETKLAIRRMIQRVREKQQNLEDVASAASPSQFVGPEFRKLPSSLFGCKAFFSEDPSNSYTFAKEARWMVGSAI